MARKNLIRLIKQRNFLFWLFLFLLFLSVFWPKRNLIWEWQEKKRIEVEIRKWEETLEKYPGYRDVYLRLAVLNWQINNQKKAKEHLQKAKELDPNFEITKKLEEKLDYLDKL
jgi:tetratricopeptide (TPR) repeat protein